MNELLKHNLERRIAECQEQLDALDDDPAHLDAKDVRSARTMLKARLSFMQENLWRILAEAERQKHGDMNAWAFPPPRKHFTPEPEPSRWGTVAGIILIVMGAVFMLLKCSGMLTR